MKINMGSAFHSEFGAVLAMLLLNNKLVVSLEEPQRRTLCKATSKNACVILCGDWNLGDLEPTEALKTEGEKFNTCTLIFDRCTHASTAWDGEINPNENPKVEELKIFYSLIHFNELNSKFFKNLRRLAMKNTTTTTLCLEPFRRLPKLEKRRMKQPTLLKRVVKGCLQNPCLNYLRVQGPVLNRTKTSEFFRNLTDRRELPVVRSMKWSLNDFGNFTKDLLTLFPKADILILTNSGIFNFKCETLTNSSVRFLKIDKSQIQKLPEKTFRSLIEAASFVFLGGSNLTRDCDMKWLQTFLRTDKRFKKFQINCTYPVLLKKYSNSEKGSATVHCTPTEHLELADDYSSWSSAANSMRKLTDRPKKFTIRNEEAKFVEISLQDNVDMKKAFLWYGNYANSTSPQFSCLKILRRKFAIQVIPETNYLICLATVHKYFRIDIFDCLPFKTSPLDENQPWLTKKSMSVSIITVFVVFLFSLSLGALILYLSVRRNPTLIRGSKRVIEVKSHDKAQVLVMPRGYENVSRTEALSPGMTNPFLPLEPSRLSLSCDTISTVSYVSANQPTQLEILTYRLNRLRDLFQRNNNFPPPVSSIPMQIAVPSNQRLPPDVDLLFEYEWYTITTTTTTSA